MHTVLSTVMKRGLFGDRKQSAVLCNYSKLEFCFLAQKQNKTKTLFFLLHGSPFLLSVPFEDIFQDDVAIDLHSFLKLHSMSDIFLTCKCCNYTVIICIHVPLTTLFQIDTMITILYCFIKKELVIG